MLLCAVLGKVFGYLAAGDGLSILQPYNIANCAEFHALWAMIAALSQFDARIPWRFEGMAQSFVVMCFLRMAECEREEGGRYLQMESEGQEDVSGNG